MTTVTYFGRKPDTTALGVISTAVVGGAVCSETVTSLTARENRRRI